MAGPDRHPDGVPTGAAMRRWTVQLGRRRRPASLADVAADLYTIVLDLLIVVALVVYQAARLGGAAHAQDRGLTVDPAWLAVAVATLAVAGLTGLLARLGPVSVNAAQGSWWLPLPVDRRSLLRAAAARALAGATLVGALVGFILAAALAVAPVGAVGVVVALAGLGAALAGALVALQPNRRAHGRLRRGADAVVVAVPVASLLGVVAGVPVLPVPPLAATTAAAVVAAVLAVLAVRAALPALDDVPDAELRERGAVAGDVTFAVTEADTQAVFRALRATHGPSRRATTSTHRVLSRVPRRWRAGATIVLADALVLARTPGPWARLLSAGAVAGAVLLLPDPPAFVVAVVVAVGAYLAAFGAAEGPRQAQAVPALDRLLPLAQRAVLRWRLVVPAAALAVWGVAVLAGAGWRFGGDVAGWATLAVLAAPAWAAAAVRAAYRPPPDWTAPLVDTPFGAFQPGVAKAVTVGPDLAIAAALPLALAVVAGGVTPLLLGVQAAVSAVAVIIATRVRTQS